MELHLWLAYVAVVSLVALSPGTAAVLSVSHGLSYGLRRTVPTIVGLQVGVAVLVLGVGLGLGAVLLTSSTAFVGVRMMGVACLLWLSWVHWRKPVERRPGGAPVVQPAGQGGATSRFFQGLLVNLGNPGGLIFVTALLPQFMRAGQALAPQLVVLLVTTFVMEGIAMTAYAALAASLRGWFSSARAQRVQNRVTAGIFMVMGAALAVFGQST